MFSNRQISLLNKTSADLRDHFEATVFVWGKTQIAQSLGYFNNISKGKEIGK